MLKYLLSILLVCTVLYPATKVSSIKLDSISTNKADGETKVIDLADLEDYSIFGQFGELITFKDEHDADVTYRLVSRNKDADKDIWIVIIEPNSNKPN